MKHEHGAPFAHDRVERLDCPVLVREGKVWNSVTHLRTEGRDIDRPSFLRVERHVHHDQNTGAQSQCSQLEFHGSNRNTGKPAHQDKAEFDCFCEVVNNKPTVGLLLWPERLIKVGMQNGGSLS